jgi:hypothetical protein
MTTSQRRSSIARILITAAMTSGCDVSEPFRVLTDERTVQRVIVTPAIVNARVADTVKLVARPVGAGGRDITEADVVWTSGDPSIARTLGEGRFVVVSAGPAEVFATTRGRRGTAQILVAR